MWKRMYDIVLKTPIGPRYGTMEIQKDCGKVNGFLNVLMGKNPFQGFIDKGDRCQITGQLRTLVRTIFYSAAGKITGDTVCLVVNTGKGTIEVTGTARYGEQEVCQ